MLITTRAIVFRTIKYRESSLIVELYTEQKGIRKYLLNGVRKAKARIPASLLQLMNLLEIVAYEREDRDLNRVKEVRLAYPYQQIPFDLQRGSLGLFLVEVAQKTIREQAENPALFSFLFQRFQQLDNHVGSLANFHLHFLLELSTHLGIMPSGEWKSHTPFFDLKEGHFRRDLPGHSLYLEEELSLHLYQLLHMELEQALSYNIPKQYRLRLLESLLRYYQEHIEGLREINSYKILREVLNA